MRVAYLANQYPSPVESYVGDEIRALRDRSVQVIPCSVRRAELVPLDSDLQKCAAETLYVFPLQALLLFQAVALCGREFGRIKGLLRRLLLQDHESVRERAKALLHTLLGAYLALLLKQRGVDHIHVHHGYFASWIGMVAARLLKSSFSLTLHGSDLLVRRAWLDVKLAECKFCVTISEYNRAHILKKYPQLDPAKVFVQRLGVDVPVFQPKANHPTPTLSVLSVGRLHEVKNYEFLIRAVGLLKGEGVPIRCEIAGDGPDRERLEQLIGRFEVEAEMTLLGHVSRGQLARHYAEADVVVLTSRSEGIPVCLMEAMAQSKIVLAPAITGIPELVVDGVTGFLYRAGSIEDFIRKLEMIGKVHAELQPVRHAARQHVMEHFNRARNLDHFCDLLMSQIATVHERTYENSLLQ